MKETNLLILGPPSAMDFWPLVEELRDVLYSLTGYVNQGNRAKIIDGALARIEYARKERG